MPRVQGRASRDADLDDVAGEEPAPRALPRPQLEHRFGAARRGGPPGLDRLGDAKHAAVAVEKDDIDREAHEERVHGAGRAKQHSFVRAETALAKQAAHARQRRVGDRAPLTDDRAVEPLNRARARAFARTAYEATVGDDGRFERVAHEEVDELDDLLLSSSV